MTNNVLLILLNLLCCSIRRFLPVAVTFTSYVEIYAATMAIGVYAIILCRWQPRSLQLGHNRVRFCDQKHSRLRL
jgi:hypothetical protein